MRRNALCATEAVDQPARFAAVPDWTSPVPDLVAMQLVHTVRAKGRSNAHNVVAPAFQLAIWLAHIATEQARVQGSGERFQFISAGLIYVSCRS